MNLSYKFNLKQNNMRKIYCISLLLIGILIASCKKDDPAIFNSKINLNNVLQFDSKYQVYEMPFEVNKNWEVSVEYVNDNDWLGVSPMNGGKGDNKLQVKIAENINDYNREAVVRFKIGDLIKDLKIKQNQKDYLSLETKSLTVPGKGMDVSVGVKSNIDYIVYIPDSCSWIKLISSSQRASSSKTFNISMNTLPTSKHGVVYFKSTESNIIDSLIIEQKPVFDYSLRGTANSYVLLPNSFGKFKISNKGNDETQKLDITNNTKHVILWVDNGKNLINDIIIVGEYLYFQTANYQGNALIALKNEGEIIWSWHLWVLNDAEEINNFTQTTRLGFMDRNLGAVNKNDPGFHYQWGRKDPFLIERYIVNNIAENINEAIKNPTIFYTSKGYDKDYDTFSWYKNMRTSLWGKEKTIYDPSPYGYIVPSINSWDVPEGAIGWEDNFFIFDTKDAYYPTKGYIDTAGTYRGWGASYWSSYGYYSYPFAWRAADSILPERDGEIGGYASYLGHYVRSIRYEKED